MISKTGGTVGEGTDGAESSERGPAVTVKGLGNGVETVASNQKVVAATKLFRRNPPYSKPKNAMISVIIGGL